MNNSSLPTLTLGLDLGDRRHSFCLIDAEARILEEASVPNSSEALAALSARFPEARIVIETGTHSPWISRLFAEKGHSVIVANARKLRAISSSNNKSDQEDARMLARLGRADPQLLSPIQHRSEDGQRALVPLKVREALVRSRVNLINTTRCLLKSLGILLPASIKANAFPKKARLQLEPANCALGPTDTD